MPSPSPSAAAVRVHVLPAFQWSAAPITTPSPCMMP
jgi:hypothetical protein